MADPNADPTERYWAVLVVPNNSTPSFSLTWVYYGTIDTTSLIQCITELVGSESWINQEDMRGWVMYG